VYVRATYGQFWGVWGHVEVVSGLCWLWLKGVQAPSSRLGGSWTNAPFSTALPTSHWSEANKFPGCVSLAIWQVRQRTARALLRTTVVTCCHIVLYMAAGLIGPSRFFLALLPAVWNLVDQEWSCQFYHIASNQLNCHNSKASESEIPRGCRCRHHSRPSAWDIIRSSKGLHCFNHFAHSLPNDFHQASFALSNDFVLYCFQV